MSSRITTAIKDGYRAYLADLERGEQRLTCETCGDRSVVKDGQGAYTNGKSRRNGAKGKHLAHTSNSQCHGEGLAHYTLKMAICNAINVALHMPANQRNFHGRIQHECPDNDFGPHCSFKYAPGKSMVNPQFPAMEHGYHDFDLLYNLAEAKTEARLGGGRTRADIAGFDSSGQVLWAIEIRRTAFSKAAIKSAESEGYVLFVVDISHWPNAPDDDPPAEECHRDGYILFDNLRNGFLPSVKESHWPKSLLNKQCKRRGFSDGDIMKPTDHSWNKEYAYLCRGDSTCGGYGCNDCEEILLHKCGGREIALCPDAAYMFKHGIGPIQMYTESIHFTKSHTYMSDAHKSLYD